MSLGNVIKNRIKDKSIDTAFNINKINDTPLNVKSKFMKIKITPDIGAKTKGSLSRMGFMNVLLATVLGILDLASDFTYKNAIIYAIIGSMIIINLKALFIIINLKNKFKK